MFKFKDVPLLRISKTNYMQNSKYILSEREKLIFKKLNIVLENHILAECIYKNALRIFEFISSEKSFLKYAHNRNSIQDVRILFDEIADNWIIMNLLVIDVDDNYNKFAEYNSITEPDVLLSLKEDIFVAVISRTSLKDSVNDEKNKIWVRGNYKTNAHTEKIAQIDYNVYNARRNATWNNYRF